MFTGYQRGNGVKSVEDTIIKALNLNSPSLIKTAARTDRGVSALSNVFYIETERRPQDIAGIINSKNEYVFVHSFAEVEHGRNPRYCDTKTYMYMLPGETECDSLMVTASGFLGFHDFSKFSKKDTRNPWRSIDEVKCHRESFGVVLEFSAKSFLWNQVRRMLAFILEFRGNKIDPFSVSNIYSHIAPPENLILKDIVYKDLSFKPLNNGLKRQRLMMEKSLISYIVLKNVLG
ncbi:tRNA pseudouridine(38-40) synthase TruA [Thermoplasma volcanium]|nr:tRNA pseudouridine(38-40) synthase TruA [Thermoplasma volcanium]